MTAVAIFVKTPGYSPIKTRLADGIDGIGQAMAEECHRRCAACVADIVINSGLDGYFAVAEAEAMDDPLWQALPRISQGTGSLGARMQHVHSALVKQHDSAILIGADLPQLTIDDLHSAGEWLDGHNNRAQNRSVLGPARDGGFWLFGANHAYPQSVWTSVDYSQSDTAEHFVQALNAGEWKKLDTRRDIDQAADIEPVVNALTQIKQPSQAQREIAAWLAHYPT